MYFPSMQLRVEIIDAGVEVNLFLITIETLMMIKPNFNSGMYKCPTPKIYVL